MLISYFVAGIITIEILNQKKCYTHNQAIIHLMLSLS